MTDRPGFILALIVGDVLRMLEHLLEDAILLQRRHHTLCLAKIEEHADSAD